MIEPRLPVSVSVVGHRWRDINGNTYHRAYVYAVYADGEIEYLASDITYGYGKAYHDTALCLLVKWGIVTRGDDTLLWHVLRRLNIPYIGHTVDVGRKRDL